MIVKYWVFNEQQLLFALARAVEAGDILATNAETIRTFLSSAHASNNQILMRANYWVFNEDQLMAVLGEAMQDETIKGDDADMIRSFLSSTHSKKGKIFMTQDTREGNEA